MQYCPYCGAHKKDITTHPLENRTICKDCYLGEIAYRTKQLENWTMSKKRIPNFTRQLESLDQINEYSVKLAKGMIYKSLAEKLRDSKDECRFDGQGGMV